MSYPVVRMLEEIVAEVKADVLTKIKANNLASKQQLYPNMTVSEISEINYQPAYVKEVVETLTEMKSSPAQSGKQFPLIMLIQLPEEHGTNSLGGIANLQIAICMDTEENWKWDDRYKYNFEPILYIIYDSLIEKIAESAYFAVEGGVAGVRHLKEDKPYWGAGAFRDGSGNKFADAVDAILINNLSLTIQNQNNCNQ